MTNKQQRIWQELCLKAVMEPNPQKQTAIVVELNRILQNQSKKAKASVTRRHPKTTDHRVQCCMGTKGAKKFGCDHA